MTYFIVNAPYEKCFDFFFQQELGYPNFYRMSELISSDEQYQDLVLLSPYPSKEPSVLGKILDKVNSLEVKCLPFGEGLETAFTFDETGKLQIHPQFEASLIEALSEFFTLYQHPRDTLGNQPHAA